MDMKSIRVVRIVAALMFAGVASILNSATEKMESPDEGRPEQRGRRYMYAPTPKRASEEEINRRLQQNLKELRAKRMQQQQSK